MRVSLLLELRRRRRRQPPPHARPPRMTPQSLRPRVSDRTIVGIIDQPLGLSGLRFSRTSSRPGMNTAEGTATIRCLAISGKSPFPSSSSLGRASSPSRVRSAAPTPRALDGCGRPALPPRLRGKGALGSAARRERSATTVAGAGCQRDLASAAQGGKCLLTSPFIELQGGLHPQPMLPQRVSLRKIVECSQIKHFLDIAEI